MGFKSSIKKICYFFAEKIYPKLWLLRDESISWHLHRNYLANVNTGQFTKLNEPYYIVDSIIGSYSYIAQNSIINITEIGKFCSVGPNFISGYGVHPTNGLSTSPMFYSTQKQNGVTLCDRDKIKEHKPVIIGNDVFIGANVTVLDGFTIGDGAVIGAGAVVSKDIPPYAIAVGVPIKVIKYRFTEDKINKLLKIKWWDFEEEKLKDVEKLFFEINKFIEKYD